MADELATTPVNEEREVVEHQVTEAKKYYLTPKFKLWETYFLDKKNAETFGNATKSACAAYGLDPTDKKAYSVAANIGSLNVKKCENLRKKFWEAQGLTHGRVYDLYNNFMVRKADVDMLYTVAEDIGAELPTLKNVTSPKSVTNTQINGSDIQISFGSMEQINDKK